MTINGMESTPPVSIVTPFYNTSAYLAECIESVLRQSYTNWQYLLVNNCSTDDSAEIAASYSNRYPEKIRLIHTSSLLPQLSNYNFALSKIPAESKYCKVVQADDWIFPECIARMVEVAEAHPSVGIVGAYELEGSFVSLDGLPYPSSEVPGREIGRMFFLDRRYLFGTPTSLLYRSDIVRSRVPFFNDGLFPFADAHVCFDLLKSCNFGFVHQVLTFSRRDNESIHTSTRSWGPQRLSRLTFIALHGRDYLNGEEYSICLKDAEREYFQFIGRAALRGQSGAFWKYHRAVLPSIGYRLDRSRLSKSIFLALCEYAGNPKRMWDAFWERRSGVESIRALSRNN